MTKFTKTGQARLKAPVPRYPLPRCKAPPVTRLGNQPGVTRGHKTGSHKTRGCPMTEQIPHVLDTLTNHRLHEMGEEEAGGGVERAGQGRAGQITVPARQAAHSLFYFLELHAVKDRTGQGGRDCMYFTDIPTHIPTHTGARTRARAQTQWAHTYYIQTPPNCSGGHVRRALGDSLTFGYGQGRGNKKKGSGTRRANEVAPRHPSRAHGDDPVVRSGRWRGGGGW